MPIAEDGSHGQGTYPLRTEANVACVYYAFVVPKDVLPKLVGGYSQSGWEQDPEVGLCAAMRQRNVFMYVNSMQDWGYLLNEDDFAASEPLSAESQ